MAAPAIKGPIKMGEDGKVRVVFPDKLQCLFWPTMPDGRPVRYRVLHGGRGGGKSWAVAQALLLKGLEKPLRILCARELQNSIDDSVHRVLKDQIFRLKLETQYEVLKDSIVGRNGTVFRFEGIRHNIARIRSYEAIDICWVEEAVKVSRSSWEVLVPTIRKDGSEIWLTFNPELEEDYIYKEFVESPPENAIVTQINWRDNPWFPAVLKEEAERLKKRDLDAYLNVWEGQCRQMLEGAVYARELKEAAEEKRTQGEVPYDRAVPVDVFFDLGFNDFTAIWFAQRVGPQIRILDYFQGSQRHISWYLKLIQKKEYTIGTVYLPHDASSNHVGAASTVEQQTRDHGFRVRIVPKTSIAEGINAVRTIFPSCWFDAKRCAEGLQALKHYRYEVDPDTKGFSQKPYHDPIWSHGADAFRYLALMIRSAKERPNIIEALKKKTFESFGGFDNHGLGWMR